MKSGPIAPATVRRPRKSAARIPLLHLACRASSFSIFSLISNQGEAVQVDGEDVPEVLKGAEEKSRSDFVPLLLYGMAPADM